MWSRTIRILPLPQPEPPKADAAAKDAIATFRHFAFLSPSCRYVNLRYRFPTLATNICGISSSTLHCARILTLVPRHRPYLGDPCALRNLPPTTISNCSLSCIRTRVDRSDLRLPLPARACGKIALLLWRLITLRHCQQPRHLAALQPSPSAK